MSDGVSDGVSVGAFEAIGSFSKDPVQLAAGGVWAYGFDPAEALRCSKSLAVRETSAGGDLNRQKWPGWVLGKNAWHVASVIQVLAAPWLLCVA